MPVYKIQTPQGVIKIEGPPGASEEQLVRIAKQHVQTMSTTADLPEEEPRGPGVVDRVAGTGESLLTVGTSATSGMLGQILGTLNGIAKEVVAGEFGSYEAADRIEAEAMKGAQALTYAPKTETGQQIIEKVGEVAEPMVALTPMAAEMGVIAQTGRRVAPIARAAAEKNVIAPLKQAVQPVVQKVEQIAQPVVQKLQQKSTAGTGQSAGAMAVDKAIQRQAAADELPVPIKLTEGQKTRTFEQQRFERETAKMPEEGAPLRERFQQQNEQLIQNMDEFIDATGAELGEGNLRGIGELVDRSLRNRAARDKIKIRSLYKEAEKAGEMAERVDVNPLARYLNENRAERAENGIMGKVQRQIDTLEVGQGAFEEGSLQLRPMTLNEAESIRRFINRNINNNDPNDVRIGMALKEAIDGATEGAGGNLYQRARAARRRYAQDYENIGLVKNLLGLKRGSEDRAIALEDVLRKSVVEPSASLDSVRQIRRLLQTEGPEGQQAWRELQGGTLRHIQEQMTKGVGRDTAGNPIVSPAQLDRAIQQLDRSGKLDFIFGKKGAEQLRTINDVAKDILTSPPGAVNTSNTATVLAGLMDVALTGTTGVPAPLASSIRLISSQIKDSKLKARVKKSLGED